MSYDIYFAPCRGNDGTTEKRLNPFTRQPMDAPRKQALAPSEVEAVLAVLTRAGATAPVAHGCRTVQFDDGGSAEISGADM